ncbi:tetratricopeptide repeat protein [Pseudoxanthomonas sp. 3HH-4]|uniref:tetratricopeptide repeat-containing sulfotransferase family protein n=1 Tax=Pseudoxanthomonas sp. 3HH-4 TaxID=1690214 RepID=UPI00116D8111|nr:sulfotransferase [Pseudoxanthomonas sp. 3HH-4]TQM12792.1 tetratricopeptide repeat protein [Pseudoxanthomonas sp. 3HH-4]
MQHIAQGNLLLRQGKVQEAVEIGTSLIQAYPGDARVFYFLAEACRVKGDLEAAIVWIDQAIQASPDPQFKIKKAWLLSRLLRRDEILPLADQIAAQAGGDRMLRWQLGKLYYHHNFLREAIRQYEQALASGPDNPSWRYDLAIARFYAGDADNAEADLNSVLRASPQAGAVIYLRSTLRRQRKDQNNVADIESRLKSPFRSAEDEAGALYALAKEQEDLGEHEKAFASLLAGAKKKRSAIQYDATAFSRMTDEIRAAQNAAAMAVPVAGHDEEGAIFILGLPRTGTTLAERILLQSGKVKDAGELMDFGFHLTAGVKRVCANAPELSPADATIKVDFAALGRDYMRGARQMAGGSERFIDKLPANYLYGGMIHKALPKAKIIHLVRDPLDSCYAIFKTLFFNAYDFSYDLDELADYYVAYSRMMQHWHEVLPGVILDVRYEDLVTDTEAQAKRIYDWCGLEWTPDALSVPDSKAVFATASAAQVREPVHTRSINSSRRHAEGLAPLIRKLTDAGFLKA